MKQAEQVLAFMKAMNQETPTRIFLPQSSIQDLRIKLIEEELEELKEATNNNNLVEVADALVDILYVTLGAFVAYGFSPQQVETLFQAVHDNNMTKLGPDGKAIYNEFGKVIKPEGYTPVNLSSIIMEDWLIKQGSSTEPKVK